jgi:hypothetical protein
MVFNAAFHVREEIHKDLIDDAERTDYYGN